MGVKVHRLASVTINTGWLSSHSSGGVRTGFFFSASNCSVISFRVAVLRRASISFAVAGLFVAIPFDTLYLNRVA